MNDENDVDAATDSSAALWPTDTGTLHDRSRRALVQLLQGPYLSRDRAKENWSALLSDEKAIRSRLSDVFLELIIDRDAEVAFVRNAPLETAPRVVRTESLTFMDTVMLLALRHALLNEEGRGRVIVGLDELVETLQVYRTADRDEADFRRRVSASWGKMMNKLRVIHSVGEERAEISPVVRLLIDSDQTRALEAAYGRARAVGRVDVNDEEESG